VNSTPDNPKITTFLRGFTLVEALVLVGAGFGLFLFPEIVRPLWPWELAPFNTRFLGAIYLGAMVPVAIMFLSGRWSPTRPVLWAIFTFTSIVLVVSLFHIERFDLKYVGTWIWFALYIGLPVSAAYHLWMYRNMPTDQLNPVPRNWRYILRAASLLLAIYGLGLILLPNTFSSLFPWKLDVFHSQLYSATFITGAVILISVAVLATRAEFVTAGAAEVTFSVFAILGLIIVDAVVKKIDWSAPNALAWLVSLAILALLGTALIVAGASGIPHQEVD